MGKATRSATVQAPNISDPWALFASLEAGITDRLGTFGSGDFYTRGYCITHQGSSNDYDTLAIAKAGSEGTAERLDTIYLSFVEDDRAERRLEVVGSQPELSASTAAWDEYTQRYRAFHADRTHSVTLIVYDKPQGAATYSFLVVSGDNPNEVLGFIQNLTAVVKSRTDALATEHRLAKPGFIQRVWRTASTNPLWSTILGGLIVLGVVAVVTLIVK